jgi:DNA-binding NtrC family response regulator
MVGPSGSVVKLGAIDDDPQSLELIREILTQEGLEILTAADAGSGIALVARHRPHIVLLDLILPDVSGMELLESILEVSPETDVILLTGHYSTDSAVEAIKKGASDYLTKPFSILELRRRIDGLIAEVRRRQLALQLGGQLARASEFEGMVGQSPLMLQVFARIRRIAPHFRTVLVTGATGTGKELAARALHRLSPVSSNRFVVWNSTAVVETLFESELFGHVKGAFTGAVRDKMGLFEFADGGCIFLDEIGDMAPPTQAKILRVLQNQEVQRIGALTPRKIDVRVIAATNCDLQARMAEKKFREDLYYRLSMVEIRLPLLAERKEDLPLLERCFVEKYSAQCGKQVRDIAPRAQALLSRHDWPGNVRELENVIGHACMMSEGDTIDVRDLPESLRAASSQEVTPDGDLLPMAELERRHAHRVLASVGGNKVRAAKILGINRATLYRLLANAENAGQGDPTD